MKKLKLKWSLIRRHRKDETEFLVGKFYSESDALWAATVFAAHKVIGKDYQSYVTDGKHVFYPSATIPQQAFNLSE